MHTNMQENMQERISNKLIEAFSPTSLKVINQSNLHAGHSGDDGSGESHFSIQIESKDFNGVARVARERMIHKALSEEIKIIHALSISANPAE